MLEDIDTREKIADPSYTDMEQLDFQSQLADNYYINPNSIDICFPVKIKKKWNTALDIDADMIPVNSFFAHFVKEINVTKYGSNKELIPTFSHYETYQYADSMLKHLLEKTLKTIKNTYLYSKKPVYYTDTGIDRRIHNGHGMVATSLTAAQIDTKKKKYAKDLNIDDCKAKFKDVIKIEYVYRIPLHYFTDLCKINFPIKIHYRVKLHLEKEMKILFESRKV